MDLTESTFAERHSYQYKQKVIRLSDLHPNWSLKTLQKNGCKKLKSMRMLKKWREDVKRGGSRYDKLKRIDEETYENFVQARYYCEQVR